MVDEHTHGICKYKTPNPQMLQLTQNIIAK